MSHLNVIGGFLFGVSGVATTALTLRPPENFNLAVFNLAINGQIKLPPNFPLYGTYTQTDRQNYNVEDYSFARPNYQFT